MPKKGADDFLDLFERAAGARIPEEVGPWDEAWTAAMRSAPLRVRVLGRAEGGIQVAYRGLIGRLLDHGAPWDEPPAEVDAWVLELDRDRGVLELLAWSPRTSPQR